MLETAVALTDYLVAAECAALSALMLRQKKSGLRTSFLLMFGSIGIAAATGGTVHGFFGDEASAGYQTLWVATLLCFGVMTLAGWRIGAALLLPTIWAKRVEKIALAAFGIYAVVVIAGAREFMTAVVNYLPAVLFMLIGLVQTYRKTKAAPVMAGITGLLLTFVASGIQQAKIGFASWLDHNTIYHLIQFAALYLIYCAGRYVTRT
jgi:hypothetical protein